MTFNSDYLLDAIGSSGARRARMLIRDALKPALFEEPEGMRRNPIDLTVVRT